MGVPHCRFNICMTQNPHKIVKTSALHNKMARVRMPNVMKAYFFNPSGTNVFVKHPTHMVLRKNRTVDIAEDKFMLMRVEMILQSLLKAFAHANNPNPSAFCRLDYLTRLGTIALANRNCT